MGVITLKKDVDGGHVGVDELKQKIEFSQLKNTLYFFSNFHPLDFKQFDAVLNEFHYFEVMGNLIDIEIQADFDKKRFVFIKLFGDNGRTLSYLLFEEAFALSGYQIMFRDRIQKILKNLHNTTLAVIKNFQ